MRGSFGAKLGGGTKGTRKVKTGMRDNENLDMALEKLVGLLTNKRDGATFAGGGAIVLYTKEAQKLELMPNYIKLEGVTNYLRWSRRTMLILNTEGLDDHVTGEASEPTYKNSSKWKKWSATNSLIVAWMLNSLVPNIAASVEAFTEVSGVWDNLSNSPLERGTLC
jgi:hypothetical protein